MAGVRVLLLNDIFLSLNSLNSVTKIYKHLGKTLMIGFVIGIGVQIRIRVGQWE